MPDMATWVQTVIVVLGMLGGWAVFVERRLSRIEGKVDALLARPGPSYPMPPPQDGNS